MAVFTTVAARRGLIEDKDARRVLELLHRFALPTDHALLDDDVLRRGMEDTVRHRDGRQRLPVPVAIGKAAFLNDVTHDELRSRCGTTGRRPSNDDHRRRHRPGGGPRRPWRRRNLLVEVLRPRRRADRRVGGGRVGPTATRWAQR
ncbi:hypothetical protein NKG94_04250 [Micromonospora sp. M12]